MVLVPKKDGTLRLCVDYSMNKEIKLDPYPMPWIDEFLDGLRAAKFITTLDLQRDTGKYLLAQRVFQKQLS